MAAFLECHSQMRIPRVSTSHQCQVAALLIRVSDTRFSIPLTANGWLELLRRVSDLTDIGASGSAHVSSIDGCQILPRPHRA